MVACWAQQICAFIHYIYNTSSPPLASLCLSPLPPFGQPHLSSTSPSHPLILISSLLIMDENQEGIERKKKEIWEECCSIITLQMEFGKSGGPSSPMENAAYPRAYPPPLLSHVEVSTTPSKFYDTLRWFHSTMGTRFMYEALHAVLRCWVVFY